MQNSNNVFYKLTKGLYLHKKPYIFTSMPAKINSYKLGTIEVVIEEADRENKLNVICNDGTYRSEFTIRKYEYENYKRHMNQRIKNAYKAQYKKEE